MPTVVIAYADFPDTALEDDILKTIGATIVRVGGLESPEQLEAARQADGLMVSIQSVPASLLNSMARCRIVSRMGTGLDAIDIPAATARGIWVTNVPDYAVDEVSTHAISLLLALARRLPRMLASTQQGVWDSSLARPFPRLRGQTLGVLGFGRIGRATAAKARGLGLEVIAHDPYVSAQTIEALGVQAVDAERLWRESDFLSLHTPLTDETRQVVNAQTLARVKPTAFLINTARGALVDDAALLQAVRSGQLAGAALDVLSVEPPPPDHPLLHEEHILITPHYAWYSEAASREVRVSATEEIVRVLRGDRPRCPANQIGDHRQGT
jgi:D-3-phosphoglycerate dehydrogenase / 2-oxoglutarate reductase